MYLWSSQTHSSGKKICIQYKKAKPHVKQLTPKIYTSNVIWTEEVIVGNRCSHTFLHVITIVKKEVMIFLVYFLWFSSLCFIYLFFSRMLHTNQRFPFLHCSQVLVLRCHEFEEEWGEFMVGFGGRKVNENICNKNIMSKK